MVGMIMMKRPRRLAAEDNLVDADHQRAGVEALGHPRLEVASAVELVEQPAAAECLGVGGERIARAAGLERCGGRFGGEHAGLDGGMAALDARGIEESG